MNPLTINGHEMRCETCVYFGPQFPTNSKFGICRAKPPVILAGRPDATITAYWPEIKADDWCGEYRQAKDILP